MSANLKNGISESKLFGKEGMSEGVSKYEKMQHEREIISIMFEIIEVIESIMTKRDKMTPRQRDYSQFELLPKRESN